MRDRSRLNAFNLVRIGADEISDNTAPHSVEGIVAYSSVCNHEGCDLTRFFTESHTFKCYCHHAEFVVRRLGLPITGPATRKLAILPLKIDAEGVLRAAGEFIGKAGF